MTGFFIKKSISDREVSQAIESFFKLNFPSFMGKFTEWSLLGEPILSEIKGAQINNKLKELKEVYAKLVSTGEGDEEE